MGATQSSDASGKNIEAAESPPSNFGFSRKESRHLELLRLMVCRERQDTSKRDFAFSIWRCSHALAFSSVAVLSQSSNSDNIKDIEAHLTPSQLALIQKRCQQLNALLIEFTSLGKMNTALERLFMSDHQQFLETVSNIIGLHGNLEKDSLKFVCNMLCGGEESLSAEDAVGLCYQMGSASHLILQEEAFGDEMKLVERRNVSRETDLIQSLTYSLLESAKTSRDDDRFGGYGGGGGASAGTSAATTTEGRVTQGEFSEWQRKTVPDLFRCSAARFLQALLFPPEFSPPQQLTPRSFPLLRSHKETTSKAKVGEIVPMSSHVFGNNTVGSASSTASTLLSPPVFAFAAISTTKFGDKWCRLFAGVEDGWVFQTLERQIMGYEGPTVLVIQAHSKNKNDGTVIFGAYTASKWERNKRDFFGSSDCFLFQLQPTLKILRPLPKMGTKGGHYMYFHSNTNVNTTNPSRKDDLAQGFGFGGTVRQPRLFVDSQLEQCTLSHQDTSFEEGSIGFPPSEDPFASQSFSSTVYIDSLEIYAVGDKQTIRKGFRTQDQYRDVADATLRNARTVDKAAFLGDMRSGLIEAKAFAHRGQVDGRAHGALKGEEEEEGGDSLFS